ncbi:MAG TPA: DUF882 domain-containing protein [Microvirga sp.]|nr:DUF882 domain-containing protein [Microvirga sp.]
MEAGRKRCRSASAWLRAARPGALAAALLGAVLCGGAREAAASGDTRSLTLLHTHTKETATITFRRGGRYDSDGLDQLNAFLRDWRAGERTTMDPRLFDILWEVYQESGSREPIHVVSAYRSPATNAALRQRSSAVSEHSQHMSGKAMDIRLPDVDAARLRAIAMKLQSGGVGYYSSAGFVHLDTGSVRAWPRMSQEQLARLFPDGKTVHLPPSGKPLPGYEEARAEIAARLASSTLASAGSGPSLLSFLGRIFGGNASPEPAPAQNPPLQTAAAAAADAMPVAVPLPPRRPASAPVHVAAVASTALYRTETLPAPARPEMAWPAPDDHRAAVRALFAAVPGGAPRPAPRITLARAQPRALEDSGDLRLFDPSPRLAGSFSKTGETAEWDFAVSARPAAQRLREAQAGRL